MGNPALNTGHPVYSKLLFCWPFKDGTGLPMEIVHSVASSIKAGAPVWATEASGVGYKFASADILKLGIGTTFLTAGAQNRTFLYRRRKDGLTGASWGMDAPAAGSECGANDPFSDNNIYFYFGGTSENAGLRTQTGQSWDDVTVDTFVFRVNSGAFQKIWRNGTALGASTGSVNWASSGADFTINKNRATAGMKQFIDLFAIYDGTLSDADCADLCTNPLNIFSFPVAGGGGRGLSLGLGLGLG